MIGLQYGCLHERSDASSDIGVVGEPPYSRDLTWPIQKSSRLSGSCECGCTAPAPATIDGAMHRGCSPRAVGNVERRSWGLQTAESILYPLCQLDVSAIAQMGRDRLRYRIRRLHKAGIVSAIRSSKGDQRARQATLITHVPSFDHDSQTAAITVQTQTLLLLDDCMLWPERTPFSKVSVAAASLPERTRYTKPDAYSISPLPLSVTSVCQSRDHYSFLPLKHFQTHLRSRQTSGACASGGQHRIRAGESSKGLRHRSALQVKASTEDPTTSPKSCLLGFGRRIRFSGHICIPSIDFFT